MELITLKNVLLRPEEDLLDPTDDAVFKFLFTSENKDSKGALKAFLSAFTEHEVKDLTLCPNEPPVTFLGDKQIRFDINCVFENGHRANIEMCMNPNENERGRSEFFASRLFVSQETKGKRYDEIVDAYQISIIDKKELTNDDSILHVYEFYDKENGVSLGGKIRIIHLEIKKLERIVKSAKDMNLKEKWGAYLKWMKDKTKIGFLNDLIKEREEFAMATEALRELTDNEILKMKMMERDKILMDWYDSIATAERKGEKRGREEGIGIGEARGREEGEKETKLLTARIILNKKFQIELISEITGLKVEEIEKLR